MDPIEALTDAPPKATRKAASAPEAADWLQHPTEHSNPVSSLITQLETDAPLCRRCGNLMQRSGSCHTCPDCGESNGCA